MEQAKTLVKLIFLLAVVGGLAYLCWLIVRALFNIE